MSNGRIIFFFIFLAVCKVNCQVKESRTSKKIIFEDFSYALFLENEKHSYFKVGYPLTNNLDLEFQNHFDTYALEDRLKTSIGLKQYISNKIYFFGGIEMEFKKDKMTNQWNARPRSSINGVLGYDVKRNFFIEAKGNIQLNDTNWGPYGELLIPMKEVYSLRGKWKF